MTIEGNAAAVWDLPLRLWHWLLVICVTSACVTGYVGGPWLVWHARSGALLLGLLAFRLVWGCIGSQPARFASFFPTPARLHAYWSGRWRGVGHTPLAALSVLALLTVLGLQVTTGLFATDDSDFAGPLHVLVSKVSGERLTHWHQAAAKVLLGLIALHASAIAFYVWVRGKDLLSPMLSASPPRSRSEADLHIALASWRTVLATALACLVAAGIFNLPLLQAPATAPRTLISDW
jgi:cytochrome b